MPRRIISAPLHARSRWEGAHASNAIVQATAAQKTSGAENQEPFLVLSIAGSGDPCCECAVEEMACQ
jgi:hypothetical protein